MNTKASTTNPLLAGGTINLADTEPPAPNGVQLPMPGFRCRNCAAWAPIENASDPRGGSVGYCHADPGQAHLMTGNLIGDNRQRVVASFVTRWEWEWCWHLPQVNALAVQVIQNGFHVVRNHNEPGPAPGTN